MNERNAVYSPWLFRQGWNFIGSIWNKSYSSRFYLICWVDYSIRSFKINGWCAFDVFFNFRASLFTTNFTHFICYFFKYFANDDVLSLIKKFFTSFPSFIYCQLMIFLRILCISIIISIELNPLQRWYVNKLIKEKR